MGWLKPPKGPQGIFGHAEGGGWIRSLPSNTRRAREKTEQIKVTRGSGNVSRDIGFQEAYEMLVKAELVLAFSRAMKSRKISQTSLADALGIDQPAVSRLLRGQTEGYSADRLMKILNKLGQDIENTVRENTGVSQAGKTVVRTMTGRARLAKVAEASTGAQVREIKAAYGAKGKKRKK